MTGPCLGKVGGLGLTTVFTVCFPNLILPPPSFCDPHSACSASIWMSPQGPLQPGPRLPAVISFWPWRPRLFAQALCGLRAVRRGVPSAHDTPMLCSSSRSSRGGLPFSFRPQRKCQPPAKASLVSCFFLFAPMALRWPPPRRGPQLLGRDFCACSTGRTHLPDSQLSQGAQLWFSKSGACNLGRPPGWCYSRPCGGHPGQDPWRVRLPALLSTTL